jgi:transcriptional regulator with XRE-family HTH domain
MTQANLAGRIGQYQSYVARLESGQRRIDVVEFLELAEALGFDAAHRRLRRCSDSQRGFLRKDVAWTFPPGVLSNACHRLPDFWNSYEKLLSCLSRL